MITSKISVEQVRSLLSYDELTGVVKWAVNFNSRARVGFEFGQKRKSKRTFYRFGKIYGKRYNSHHIAWAIYYGVWPEGAIDHINHNGLDNRIENLRVVQVCENNRNVRLRTCSTSGQIGVSWYSPKGKWRVQIGVDGRNTHVGYFLNIDDAVLARKEASKLHGYHPNHGKSDE